VMACGVEDGWILSCGTSTTIRVPDGWLCSRVVVL
jgi:hypothetical protein